MRSAWIGKNPRPSRKVTARAAGVLRGDSVENPEKLLLGFLFDAFHFRYKRSGCRWHWQLTGERVRGGHVFSVERCHGVSVGLHPGTAQINSREKTLGA